MPHEVDYLPVATGTGNNSDTQANFSGSTYQQQGFTTGIALPNQANKIWRQASMMAAALANFISNALNIDVLDDGNLTALVTILTNAITAAVQSSFTLSFSFTAGNSYVAFPAFLTGGTTRLIIKWGAALAQNGTLVFDSTYPFGAQPAIALGNHSGSANISSASTTQFTVSSNGTIDWVAIGHS